jgi:hypothetical protein
MPLSPDFQIAISTDRETLTISDLTTYGGDNEDRNELNVSIELFKVDVENEETEIAVTGNDGTPTSDSSWSGRYGVDGHYKIIYTATLQSDDSEVIEFTYRRVLSFHSQWKFAQLISNQSVNVDQDDLSSLQKVIELDNLLTGAIIADNRTEVSDGETICRRIQSSYINGAN